MPPSDKLPLMPNGALLRLPRRLSLRPPPDMAVINVETLTLCISPTSVAAPETSGVTVVEAHAPLQHASGLGNPYTCADLTCPFCHLGVATNAIANLHRLRGHAARAATFCNISAHMPRATGCTAAGGTVATANACFSSTATGTSAARIDVAGTRASTGYNSIEV